MLTLASWKVVMRVCLALVMMKSGHERLPARCSVWRPQRVAIKAMGRLGYAIRTRKFWCNPHDIGLLWKDACSNTISCSAKGNVRETKQHNRFGLLL